MSSIYEGLYKKEHDLLLEAKRENLRISHENDELLGLLVKALASFKEELLERDLLWATRDTMRAIELRIHGRCK